MTDWRTDEPPTGQMIEFETDTRTRAQGVLHFNGTRFSAYAKGHRPDDLRKQYTSEAAEGFFEVLRWRNVNVE